MIERTYYRATGRRKCAVARVQIVPGAGEVVINGKPLAVYFPRPAHQRVATEPLRAVGAEGTYSIMAKVLGGGVSGQAGAVSHGLARALLEAAPDSKSELRRAGLLTRDSRVKERKKYGLKRARKAPQYTKR